MEAFTSPCVCINSEGKLAKYTSTMQAARPVLGSRSASPSGDSLAAMEAAMKLAAEREESKKKAEQEEEEEEKAARQPLLNDTSFDRRRVTAVYKDDGSRGHHMQVRPCNHQPYSTCHVVSCSIEIMPWPCQSPCSKVGQQSRPLGGFEWILFSLPNVLSLPIF